MEYKYIFFIIFLFFAYFSITSSGLISLPVPNLSIFKGVVDAAAKGLVGLDSLSVCLRGWKPNDALCIESIFDATETDGRTDRHDVDEGNHLLIAIEDDLLKSPPPLLTSFQIINAFESFNSLTRTHLRFYWK